MTALDHFTREVRALLDREAGIGVRAEGVAGHLRALLRAERLLDARFREPGETEPRAHLVYVAPERDFSIVSFVWQPGQETCVHDHVCWCVVGVLEGVEEETRYRLKGDGDERWLEPRETVRVEPGHVCALVPPDEDIHQVRNAGAALAVSLHVYGTDIEQRGTSINRRFDLPIRRGRRGTVMRWRGEPVAP